MTHITVISPQVPLMNYGDIWDDQPDSCKKYVITNNYVMVTLAESPWVTMSEMRMDRMNGQWWQWCWWNCYVGDFMMVTDFRFWWQNHYVGDFFRYVGDFSNLSNRSPTSWISHQHLKLITNTFGLQHPSPTSMKPWLIDWPFTSVVKILR